MIRISRTSIGVWSGLLACAFVCLAPAQTAPAKASAASAKAATASPAAAPEQAAEDVFPQSVFDDDPKAGKDPFFPNSTRRSAVVAPPKKGVVVNLSEAVALKGISGTEAQRLAIINSRTFAVGEKGEVNSSAGKIHVQVLEIRDDAAVVILNGTDRRELRLRFD